MSVEQKSQGRLLRRRFRHRQAFTLVEVVIATFILAIGIASSLIGLRVGFGMVELSRDQTMASQFLQSEIETLRLLNWNELTELPRQEPFSVQSDFDSSVEERFSCVRNIEDVWEGYDMKRVTLTTNWTTTNGVDRQLVYHTIIAKDGINDYYYRSL